MKLKRQTKKQAISKDNIPIAVLVLKRTKNGKITTKDEEGRARKAGGNREENIDCGEIRRLLEEHPLETRPMERRWMQSKGLQGLS